MKIIQQIVAFQISIRSFNLYLLI